MKAVILAGGLGTRIAEETNSRPKPMVEIGGQPILWHIMKSYAAFGVTDFVICCGYRGYMIKEYFANYLLHRSDVTVDLATGRMDILAPRAENWRVTMVDTGLATMTGGRIKRVAHHLEGVTSFCMTYGDGLADLDIGKLVAFHQSHGKLATVTAVRSPARFGALSRDGAKVSGFLEKHRDEGGWINGGFFVLSPKVIDYIRDDSTSWEVEPLSKLAADGELQAFEHAGFWQPMDTLRERNLLEDLWQSGRAPWKNWS
jgi:glucose-1-phosphate cytidylyltransferase